MKIFSLLILALGLSSATNAQKVELILDKTEWSKSEVVQFTVKASPEYRLEIALFSEDEVVLYQMSQLSGEEELFEVDMKDYPANDYHILILGDDIHVQKDFVLKE